jgi:hypothetical protein
MGINPELTPAPEQYNCKICRDKKLLRMSDGGGGNGVQVPCPSCMKEAGVDAIADVVTAALKDATEDDLRDVIMVGRRAQDKHRFGESLPEGFPLKERYDISCPYCEASFFMRPGLSLQMGRNSGHGRCLGCKKHFHIQIDVRDNTAKTICWDVPGA